MFEQLEQTQELHSAVRPSPSRETNLSSLIISELLKKLTCILTYHEHRHPAPILSH